MSSHDPGGPVAADAFVHLVADELIAGLRAGHPPALVHVTGQGHRRGEVGLEALDGRHPSELLIGFTAPPEWHALGLAVRGHAYPLDERSTARPRRARVQLVTIISRSGEVAQRLHVADDVDLATALESASAEEATGEQIDLLRLALGLSTDDPPCGSAVYWAIEWLSAVLGADPDELGTWDDVTARHPATRLLHGAGRRAGDIVEVAEAFARVCTWSRLRRWARDGTFTPPELVPSDGAWFDDGAFARFLLSRCPPLTMLRAQVGEHLDDDLAARLERVLDDLHVPAAAWPEVSAGAPGS